MTLSTTILQDRYVIARKFVGSAPLLAGLIDQAITEGVPMLVGGHLAIAVVRGVPVIVRGEAPNLPVESSNQLNC